MAQGGEPPRARGRHGNVQVCSKQHGRTPACAGPTSWISRVRLSTQENPRVRGADLLVRPSSLAPQGEPPRARGRLYGAKRLWMPVRRTPACAGPTGSAPHPAAATRGPRAGRGRAEGEPPRARGRRPVSDDEVPRENPRVRGADDWRRRPGENPRVRGADATDRPCRATTPRENPACAGPTTPARPPRTSTRETPRARGRLFLTRDFTAPKRRTHSVHRAGHPASRT